KPRSVIADGEIQYPFTRVVHAQDVAGQVLAGLDRALNGGSTESDVRDRCRDRAAKNANVVHAARVVQGIELPLKPQREVGVVADRADASQVDELASPAGRQLDALAENLPYRPRAARSRRAVIDDKFVFEAAFQHGAVPAGSTGRWRMQRSHHVVFHLDARLAGG